MLGVIYLIMGKRKVSNRSSSRQKVKRFSCKPPDGWTVYYNKHAPDDKVKMLDQLLYKEKTGVPLSNTEQRIYEDVLGHNMQVSFSDGVYSFLCDKLPQSLNQRDTSHRFVKQMYQATWDGIVLKMSESHEANGLFPIKEPVVAFYQPYRKRAMDMDNSASGVKSIFDAFVHMGVLLDDNPDCVYDYIPRRPIKSKDERFVLKLIVVEPGTTVDSVIRCPSGRTVRV